MAISALAAAKRICERSGWTISNLKLQKILYMAQMAYMGENNGAPLISDGRFEAWDYGPVEPGVYAICARFGRHPIQDIAEFPHHIDESSREIRAIDRYANQLLHYKPAQLVSMTHWEGGAWARNYVPGCLGQIIPPEDIVAEYHARAGD